MSQVGFIIKEMDLLNPIRARGTGDDENDCVIINAASSGGEKDTKYRNSSVIQFRNSRYNYNSSRGLYVLGFVLLSFCIREGFCIPEDSSSSASTSGSNNNEIQSKIRNFLELHCKKQNQSLEQMEFVSFKLLYSSYWILEVIKIFFLLPSVPQFPKSS